MSGFRKCHLLCDLPKVLTDKSKVCAVELVLPESDLPKKLTDKSKVCAVELELPEYFVPSIKTLRECLA